jgi:hypothetical protein
MKKPGAVSRPGTLREFQFHESTDLGVAVKVELMKSLRDRETLCVTLFRHPWA